MNVCRYALQYVPVSVLVSQRQPLGESNQVAGDIISSETVNSRRLTDRTGSVFSSSFPLSPEEADQTDEKWINLWIPSYLWLSACEENHFPQEMVFFPKTIFSKTKNFFFSNQEFTDGIITRKESIRANEESRYMITEIC